MDKDRIDSIALYQIGTITLIIYALCGIYSDICLMISYSPTISTITTYLSMAFYLALAVISILMLVYYENKKILMLLFILSSILYLIKDSFVFADGLNVNYINMISPRLIIIVLATALPYAIAICLTGAFILNRLKVFRIIAFTALAICSIPLIIYVITSLQNIIYEVPDCNLDIVCNAVKNTALPIPLFLLLLSIKSDK